MDVFIFDPRYAGYPDSGKPQQHTLRRETLWNDRPSGPMDGCLFRIIIGLAGVLPISLALMGVSLVYEHWLGLVVAVGLIGTFLIFIGRFIRQWLHLVRQERERYRRLITPGAAQILPGEILSSQIETIHSFNSGTSYRTFVTYQFSTPAGRLLSATTRQHKKIAVPPAGTPVRVLYADDDTYVML